MKRLKSLLPALYYRLVGSMIYRFCYTFVLFGCLSFLSCEQSKEESESSTNPAEVRKVAMEVEDFKRERPVVEILQIGEITPETLRPDLRAALLPAAADPTWHPELVTFLQSQKRNATLAAVLPDIAEIMTQTDREASEVAATLSMGLRGAFAEGVVRALVKEDFEIAEEFLLEFPANGEFDRSELVLVKAQAKKNPAAARKRALAIQDGDIRDEALRLLEGSGGVSPPSKPK